MLQPEEHANSWRRYVEETERKSELLSGWQAGAEEYQTRSEIWLVAGGKAVETLHIILYEIKSLKWENNIEMIEIPSHPCFKVHEE